MLCGNLLRVALAILFIPVHGHSGPIPSARGGSGEISRSDVESKIVETPEFLAASRQAQANGLAVSRDNHCEVQVRGRLITIASLTGRPGASYLVLVQDEWQRRAYVVHGISEGVREWTSENMKLRVANSEIEVLPVEAKAATRVVMLSESAREDVEIATDLLDVGVACGFGVLSAIACIGCLLGSGPSGGVSIPAAIASCGATVLGGVNCWDKISDYFAERGDCEFATRPGTSTAGETICDACCTSGAASLGTCGVSVPASSPGSIAALAGFLIFAGTTVIWRRRALKR